ncbi:MAG: Sap, sulfolipid-addressing protein, partial [Actinomycetota bacterium]
MNDLLTQVLPFAIAAAISPTVLTVVVLILAGAHKPLARAWAFALGGVLFTIVFVFLSVTVLGNLSDANSGHQSTVSRVVKVALAALLLGLAVRQLVRARKAGPATGSSKWQKRLAGARTVDFVGVGALV